MIDNAEFDLVEGFTEFAEERGAGDPPVGEAGYLPDAIDMQLGILAEDPETELKRKTEQFHPPVHRYGRTKPLNLKDTAGGSVEVNLGFTAQSVQVYNLSETWFQLDIGLWIPPGLYGAILPLVPGRGRGKLLVGVPPGVTQGSAIGEYCFVNFLEDRFSAQGVLLGSLV